MTNPAMRRAVLMLVSTAAAIVGLVLLVAAWTNVAKTTIAATDAGDTPCLVAFGATDGPLQQASVHYEIMPPASVCSWVVEGVQEDVVVADTSATTVTVALVLLVAGAAGTITLLVLSRRRARVV